MEEKKRNKVYKHIQFPIDQKTHTMDKGKNLLTIIEGKIYGASKKGNLFNNLKSNFMKWNKCLQICNERICGDMKDMEINTK